MFYVTVYKLTVTYRCPIEVAMNKGKFYLKYARSFLFRNKPVVCHFFATERCNLRCPYCTVFNNPRPEVDLESTKKIIDRIAKLGIANFSITGGEPLLRREIYDIINYAATKIPYVRITSNGLLPLEYYKKLLASRIDGFSISVDSVESSEPLQDKQAVKSFEVIDYLFKNKGSRRMNISTSFHGTNGDELKRLIDFCAKHWPGLSIFIQPIVVGKGNLRAEGDRIDPNSLFELSRAPNVANTEFFNKICKDYYTNPNFVFKCMAGRLFLGVRPNGELWACHDVPTPLNVLDEDFFAKYKALDFAEIADPKKCGSCVYSCYINLQKGFESFSPALLLEHLKSFVSSFKRK